MSHTDQAKDTFKKNVKLPCEDEKKCCLCIELGLGMKIFAVLSFIGAILNIVGLAGSFSLGLEMIILSVVITLISVYVALIWWKWWKADNKETTG